MGRSRGTLPIQLAGNIKHGGLVEKAFGVTLRELLYDFGGGSAHGPTDPRGAGRRPAGGLSARSRSSTRRSTTRPSRKSAACSVTAASWCSTIPSTWRTGPLRDGILRDRILRQVHALPHRLDARRRGHRPASCAGERRGHANLTLLRDLCDTMLHGSLCALGGMTPFPVLTALNHFPEDFSETDGCAAQRAEATGLRRINVLRPRHGLRHPGPRVRARRSRSRSTACEVTVPAGTSVMRAAAHAGFRIPKLCATDSSRPSAPAACAWCRSRAGRAIRPRARRRWPRA